MHPLFYTTPFGPGRYGHSQRGPIRGIRRDSEDLLELVEDVLLNRRPDSTDRLLAFAETVKGEGKQQTKDESWREESVEERLATHWSKALWIMLKRIPRKRD